MKKRSDAPKEGSRGANGREGRGLLSVAVWPGTFEFLISLALLLAAGGCGKKPDVTTQAAELEKAFPAAAAATDAQPQKQAAGQTPAATVADGYVKEALLAVRANDYAAGVVALQTAQRLPGVTADQLMALERAKQAFTGDLVARADRGDAKAKADLAAIEKTHSQ
jgi:hypothetical protein